MRVGPRGAKSHHRKASWQPRRSFEKHLPDRTVSRETAPAAGKTWPAAAGRTHRLGSKWPRRQRATRLKSRPQNRQPPTRCGMLALARCFTWNIRRLPVAVGRPTRTPLAHLQRGWDHGDAGSTRSNPSARWAIATWRRFAGIADGPVPRCAVAPVGPHIAQWSASPNCPPDLFHVKHVVVE